MQDLILSLLLGIVGGDGDIANEVAKKNAQLPLSFRILLIIFSMLFTGIYLIGLSFFCVIYLSKGFPILWQSLSIFSLIFALTSVILLVILEKYSRK